MKSTGALSQRVPSLHLRHARPEKTALLSPPALPLRDYPLAAGVALPSILPPAWGSCQGAPRSWGWGDAWANINTCL